MQALFGIEVGRQTPNDAIAQVTAETTTDSETRGFVNALVFGTVERREELDAIIVPLLREWTLDRISVVDRVILRMALFEMRYADPTTPPAVVIDEAVEIAKRFSSKESSSFINGILSGAIAA